MAGALRRMTGQDPQWQDDPAHHLMAVLVPIHPGAAPDAASALLQDVLLLHHGGADRAHRFHGPEAFPETSSSISMSQTCSDCEHSSESEERQASADGSLPFV